MPVSNEGYPKASVTASNYFVKQGKNQTIFRLVFFLEKVNATIPKGIVGGFVFTVLSKNCTRGHGRMFASAKGTQQMYVPCTMPFGIVGLYFFVDNLSRNSCTASHIYEPLMLKMHQSLYKFQQKRFTYVYQSFRFENEQLRKYEQKLDISVLYEIQSKVSFDRIDKRYYYKLYVKKTLIQVFPKKKYKRKKSLNTKSCVNVP